MSLLNQANGRVYARRFDHEEARARHLAGESIKVLAAEYGVTYRAVHQVVTPGEQARTAEYNRAWRTTSCEVCGGEAMRLITGKIEKNPDGRVLCLSCRGKERRENVIVGAHDVVVFVRCATCGEWKDPDAFPRGSRYPDLREGGFHNQCRTCQTVARQAYRERHKVPCIRCGTPRLPANEKGGRRTDTGLCLACYRATRSLRDTNTSTKGAGA